MTGTTLTDERPADETAVDAPPADTTVERPSRRERMRTALRRPSPWMLVPIACIALATYVAWRLLDVLLHTGANSPTGDDVWPLARFIEPTVSGTYNWRNVLLDAYGNGQTQAVTFSIYYLMAKATDLNYVAFAWYGVIAGAIRVVATWALATRVVPRTPWRWVLLPLIAAATFSFGQIALYEFDVTVVPFGTTMTLFAVGMWGLVRFAPRWPGVLFATLLPLVASFTGAVGPLAWPIFLVLLITYGYRSWKQYVVFLAGFATVVATYYSLYRIVGPSSIQPRADDNYTLKLLGNLLGLPFGGAGLPTTDTYGYITLGLAGVGIFGALALLFSRVVPFRELAPAASFMAFGTMCVGQLYLIRGFSVQYYAYAGMHVWIGMLMLAYALLARDWKGRRVGLVASLAATWAVACVCAFVAMHWAGNRMYEDKMLFTRWRTLVTESCVRNYRTAPTTCEIDMVPWAVARLPEFAKSLAQPLERTALGPFARDQRWSLQGDFILPSVSVQERGGDVRWTPDAGLATLPFRAPEHLDLVVPTNSSVAWDIDLSHADDARLQSRIEVSRREHVKPGDATFEGVVEVTPFGGEAREVFRGDVRRFHDDTVDVDVDLERYLGERVTVTFRVESDAAGEVVFDMPHVDVEVDTKATRDAQEQLDAPYPQPAEDDFTAPVGDLDAWTYSSMEQRRVEGDDGRFKALAVEGERPMMELREPLSLCASEYSMLVFTLGVSPPWTANGYDLVYQNHAARFFYRLKGETGYDDTRSMLVPFTFAAAPDTDFTSRSNGEYRWAGDLGDASGALVLRRYYVPLKNLELLPDARIEGIAFAPYDKAMRDTENQVVLDDLRLVRAPDAPSTCP